MSLIYTLNGLLVQDLNGLVLVRLLSLIQIIAAAYLCLSWFDKITGDRPRSLLLSVMTFTLPSFMVAVSWAGCSVDPPTILLSILAAGFARKTPFNKWRGLLSGKFWLAVLFFLLANLTYAAAAVFYWPLVFILFVEEQRKPVEERKGQFLTAGAAGIATYGIYAVILKIIHWFSAANHLDLALPSVYNPHVINLDFIRKIVWFFREPFFNALNLWNIFPNWLLPVLLALIAGAAYGIYLMKNGWQTLPRIIGMTFVFLLLSFFPNLMATSDLAFYRCLAGLGPLILLITYLLLNYILRAKGWDKFFTIILFAGIIIGPITANQTIFKYRALPSLIETNYFTQQFENIPLRQDVHLYYSGLDADPAAVRYDEFGTYTLNFLDDLAEIPVCFMRIKAKKENYLLAEVGTSQGCFIPQCQSVFFFWRHPGYPKARFMSRIYVTTWLTRLPSEISCPTRHISLFHLPGRYQGQPVLR
ncbi:MAG: hypothetical protein AB1650_07170 [Candidatus Omnitrophota bacterium]